MAEIRVHFDAGMVTREVLVLTEPNSPRKGKRNTLRSEALFLFPHFAYVAGHDPSSCTESSQVLSHTSSIFVKNLKKLLFYLIHLLSISPYFQRFIPRHARSPPDIRVPMAPGPEKRGNRQVASNSVGMLDRESFSKIDCSRLSG